MRYWWWQITESFHFSERPYGFGEVVGDGDMVEFSDEEVRELLSTPANFGLCEADCEMLRIAASS